MISRTPMRGDKQQLQGFSARHMVFFPERGFAVLMYNLGHQAVKTAGQEVCNDIVALSKS